MRKRKKRNYSFRNSRKNIFAILGDNKKYLMPVAFVLAVVITVAIALSANKRMKESATVVAEADLGSTLEINEIIPMSENAYDDVNYLINEYYEASANGDSETIASIYKGLEDTELLKAVAAADYIEGFRNITVYTKPGPVSGSYVAYVYNEVKLYDYDKAVPGLETLYICTDDDGKLYINGDIANASEIEYLRQVNVQEDVIDLNNKVATEYNEMVNSDEALAELLTKMREGLQVSVGEALASSEATTNAAAEETSTEEAATEATSEESVVTVTTHTIRATDVINIRSSDSETADIISKTKKGEEFKQLEALANGWSKIEYNNGVAYVKTEFFEVVGEETVEVSNDTANEESQETQTTTDDTKTTVKSSDTGKMKVSDTVRLRKSQSTESEVLEMIYSGSTVNVVEQYASGWAKVEYNKKTGYIKSEFLTKE
ncbi:SH3 domain-containing protein [Butyrivibrio sp. VCB2006]|uniref:SH3 domain-containing protein n=1 Tax=Butyrivibrio sp. VCB2006 TaxID=1280679 RepID=UPI00040E1E73|nr:SH3 domain-containing protein [Butyrivibrio sp. VCB2006]